MPTSRRPAHSVVGSRVPRLRTFRCARSGTRGRVGLHPAADQSGTLTQTKEETKLHNHDLGRVIHFERQREIERRLRLRSELPPHPPRQSVRQAIGRMLIRLGSHISADGPMPARRPVAPRRPETQQ
jgi:hypothetical protein